MITLRKPVVTGLFVLSLALGCSGDQPYDMDAEVAAANTAVKALAGALQTELKAAMQAGGPVSAITVCNTQALAITQQVSLEQGVVVHRVSQRNRNPVNSPNEWQAAVLDDFERRKSSGADTGDLQWSEITNVAGGQEFRFMKAIPTGGVCLACHGTELSDQVSEVISGLYPEDRATGFSVGDIRGAFVVTRRL